MKAGLCDALSKARSMRRRLGKGRSRLTDMHVREVSMVGLGGRGPANKREFIVCKAAGQLRLPTARKADLQDGIAQLLDRLVALATVVGEAEADDGAPVPLSLGLALRQLGEQLADLGEPSPGK